MFRCESVKKLCTCVKHSQTISTEGKYCSLFSFNIFVDDYDILSSQSYIWWWWPLNWRLLCVKNNKMFHDTWLCIILWLCCTCQWVATWRRQTALTEEDILYLCICLYFESIWKTKQRIIDVHLAHIGPLPTRALMHMKHHSHIEYAQRHMR